MAASRRPGPIGLGNHGESIDGGTLCRNSSPVPGPVCATRTVKGNDSVNLIRAELRNHPIIELIHNQEKTAEKVDHRMEQADLGITAMQIVMGGRAFRKYHALSETAVLNKAGNFRGMVVSAKWNSMFRFTSHVGEYAENVGLLASLAAGIAESAPQIETIVGSSDSAVLKGMQISAKAGTIAERALLGVVPAGAHVIYRSLEGWCMLAGLPGGRVQSGALQCISTIKNADRLVRTTFQTLTDTESQSRAVWWVVDLFAHARR